MVGDFEDSLASQEPCFTQLSATCYRVEWNNSSVTAHFLSPALEIRFDAL
jgi:hypothetical protein